MPKGYVIMTEVIRDPAGMAAHGAVTYDSLVEHRAKMLVVDADYEVREGTWEAGSRLAIMEFESPEVARHWYESEAGQEAHALRRAAADCNVLIASGFVPKNPGNKLAAYPEPVVPDEEGTGLRGEARGLAPGRGRMVGRRVVVVGGGQTDFQLEDQPIGNGRALAVLLGREGAQVVVVDRNEASADDTVALIRAEGATAHTVVADVSDPDSIDAMITAAQSALGGIDGLVYNVGIPGPVGLRGTDARGLGHDVGREPARRDVDRPRGPARARAGLVRRVRLLHRRRAGHREDDRLRRLQGRALCPGSGHGDRPPGRRRQGEHRDVGDDRYGDRPRR